MRTTTPRPPLEVYLLGVVDFLEIQQIQRRLAYEQSERGGASLIICEHPPTISVGRQGSRMHIDADDDELASMGIRVHWVNRGGGCVLHLPGQLACYLILPLEAFGLTPMRHVEGLLEVIVRLLEEFDLRGEARMDSPGVFLGSSRVASLGVAVNRGIAYHGFTLNVAPYLGPFGLLSEPGLGGSALRQTSMQARRQRPTSMSKTREALIRWTEEVFGLDRHHLHTHHPQLRRKVLYHVYAPSPG